MLYPPASDGGANAIAFKGRQSFFYQIDLPESPFSYRSTHNYESHYNKREAEEFVARGYRPKTTYCGTSRIFQSV